MQANCQIGADRSAADMALAAAGGINGNFRQLIAFVVIPYHNPMSHNQKMSARRLLSVGLASWGASAVH